MATVEALGLLSLYDENGNRVLLYPVTTVDAVDGLDDALENVRSSACKHTNINVTLPAGGWVDNSQTISVDGVTELCTIIVGSDISCEQEYADCEVYCSEQGNGTLNFLCTYKPNEDLIANIALIG